jgi:hypothetical protein
VRYVGSARNFSFKLLCSDTRYRTVTPCSETNASGGASPILFHTTTISSSEGIMGVRRTVKVSLSSFGRWYVDSAILRLKVEVSIPSV